MIEEAYRTLMLDPSLGTGGGNAGADFLKTIDDKILQGFLPVTAEFFAWRVSLYETLTPPQPSAEVWGSLFYVKQKVWLAETPQQQGQSPNMMVGLLKARRQAKRGGQGAGTAGSDQTNRKRFRGHLHRKRQSISRRRQERRTLEHCFDGRGH